GAVDADLRVVGRVEAEMADLRFEVGDLLGGERGEIALIATARGVRAIVRERLDGMAGASLGDREVPEDIDDRREGVSGDEASARGFPVTFVARGDAGTERFARARGGVVAASPHAGGGRRSRIAVVRAGGARDMPDGEHEGRSEQRASALHGLS